MWDVQHFQTGNQAILLHYMPGENNTPLIKRPPCERGIIAKFPVFTGIPRCLNLYTDSLSYIVGFKTDI